MRVLSAIKKIRHAMFSVKYADIISNRNKSSRDKYARLWRYSLYGIIGLVISSILISIVERMRFKLETETSPLNNNAQPLVYTPDMWMAVKKQNWFGAYVAEENHTKKPATAAVPITETQLKLMLRGIAYGAHPSAVIDESGHQTAYAKGDTLTSHNAQVADIFPDYVLLRYQGRLERLSLRDNESDSLLAKISSGTAVPKTQAVGDTSSAVQTPTDGADTLLDSVRQILTRDPQKLFNYLRLKPIQKEGSGYGWEVSPGADRTLFDASGLQAGDIAVALNGQQLADRRQAMTAMMQLTTMSSFTLTILRNGEQHDITISLR